MEAERGSVGKLCCVPRFPTVRPPLGFLPPSLASENRLPGVAMHEGDSAISALADERAPRHQGASRERAPARHVRPHPTPARAWGEIGKKRGLSPGGYV